MAKCVHCSNDYDKTFEIIKEGKSYNFDSFECAIQMLAPICKKCHCKIIGHGLEKNSEFFCCAECARQMGIDELQDRA